MRYMAMGRGESGREVLAGSGDFGGGDAPIPEAQLRAAGQPILELADVLIGIVIIYELPDVKGELKLTGPMLASIFLGKIKSWNDPAIEKLNPDMKLPELPSAGGSQGPRPGQHRGRLLEVGLHHRTKDRARKRLCDFAP